MVFFNKLLKVRVQEFLESHRPPLRGGYVTLKLD
jgi:hypothetical protein